MKRIIKKVDKPDTRKIVACIGKVSGSLYFSDGSVILSGKNTSPGEPFDRTGDFIGDTYSYSVLYEGDTVEITL